MKTRFEELIDELREEARKNGNPLLLFAHDMKSEINPTHIVAHGNAKTINEIVKLAVRRNPNLVKTLIVD